MKEGVMKKIFVIAVTAALLAAFAVPGFAVPPHEKVSTKQMLVDRNGDQKIDGIDVYDESGRVAKKGYDTNSDMVIDRWEAYDENTGTYIVTESDKAFELR
jgi:hypothetical protein